VEKRVLGRPGAYLTNGRRNSAMGNDKGTTTGEQGDEERRKIRREKESRGEREREREREIY
jgi:hypothetical protein